MILRFRLSEDCSNPFSKIILYRNTVTMAVLINSPTTFKFDLAYSHHQS